MKISLLLCFFIIIIVCSGCVIRVSIEDGCDRVSGVPEEEMAEVIQATKENVYEQIDSEFPQEEIKETLSKPVQEEIKE